MEVHTQVYGNSDEDKVILTEESRKTTGGDICAKPLKMGKNL